MDRLPKKRTAIDVSGVRLLSIAAVACVVALNACGGGGDDEEQRDDPNDPTFRGRGSVTIVSPSSTTVSTEEDFINLSGVAFISPDRFRCCSGSATDTGVFVTWANSTGGNGATSQTVGICSAFGTPFLCNHKWTVRIPLVMGTNVIRITATDLGSNEGTDGITVTRTGDRTAPRISQTSPSDFAVGVPVSSSVSVTFNEPMDPDTINVATFGLRDAIGDGVPGTVVLNGQTATFAPSNPFAGSSRYTAMVTTGAKDVAGNRLGTAFSWSFTTSAAPDVTGPGVVSTAPRAGETCAAPDSVITVVFNESIDPTTLTASTFSLADSATNVVSASRGVATTTVSLVPNVSLAPSATYTGTVTTGIKDTSGNSMPANHAWSFTTAGPGVGTWTDISSVNAPGFRTLHTAVWTGSELLFWGSGDHVTQEAFPGGRYNPATDTWSTMSTIGAPLGRDLHVAVWTGTEMVVWGGNRIGFSGYYMDNGGRYDPVTDTWRPVSTVGAPHATRYGVAVWTGTEMLVFGGLRDSITPTDPNDANARYNPATDTWAPISPLNAPDGRIGHSAVWTGSRMIVWGGSPGYDCPSALFGGCRSTGGIYDPVADAWTPTSLTGAPAGRSHHSAVWTGSEMAVWGGQDSMGALASGGLFNPQTNSWRPMSTNCAPAARTQHGAVWTGSEMIVWDGYLRISTLLGLSSKKLASGGRYNPMTDSWQHTATVNAPSSDDFYTVVWTGSSMLAWGVGYFGNQQGRRYVP
jgi:Bacterial Ig-like domain/Galactose oxidase, central domain